MEPKDWEAASISPSHIEDKGEEHQLLILPGYAYYAMIFCAGGALFLVLAPTIAAWGKWHLIESNAAGMIIIFFIIFLFFFALTLNFRSPRVLIANEQGISLRRGTKNIKTMPWEDIKEVCYGAKFVTMWIWVPKVSYTLIINDQNRRDNIVVNELLFRISDGRLEDMTILICKMAQARGIPVYKIKKHIPQFFRKKE